MKRPAIFFDRDNTLIANDGYLGDPGKVVLISGAAQAIARARSLGFAVVTVSNQSGVGRGMFTEQAVHLVNSRMDELLIDQHPNARIDRHEFCPYHPDAVVERYKRESDLRKPKPGMILQAADRLNLDLHQSWVIGDAPRDIEAGRASGCRTIFFADVSLAASPAAGETPAVEADFHVTSLKDALDIIEQNKMNNAKTPVAETKEQTAPADAVEPPAKEKISAIVEATEPATAIAVETPVAVENEEAPVVADKDESHVIVADKDEAAVVVADREVPPTRAAGPSVAEPAFAAAKAPARAPAVAQSPEAPRKMTFAERVKAGTFQPARSATAAGPAAVERPKRAAAAHDPATPVVAGAGPVAAGVAPVAGAATTRPVAHAAAPTIEPGMRPTEPIGDSELLEPLLQQILEEVRLMRQQHHPGTEFAVTKLLAGIVQVLVLPALFFAYLNRATSADLQSLLLLATFLQTLTISLLIMGRQQ